MDQEIFIAAQYVSDNKFDIFSFMGILPTDDISDIAVQNAIRKQYKINCKLLHPDKSEFGDIVLLNVNKILYKILTNEEHYRMYNEYINGLNETKGFYELKTNKDQVEIPEDMVYENQEIVNALEEEKKKSKEDILNEVENKYKSFMDARNNQNMEVDGSIYETVKHMNKADATAYFNTMFETAPNNQYNMPSAHDKIAPWTAIGGGNTLLFYDDNISLEEMLKNEVHNDVMEKYL